jgi:hypothetical protein
MATDLWMLKSRLGHNFMLCGEAIKAEFSGTASLSSSATRFAERTAAREKS